MIEPILSSHHVPIACDRDILIARQQGRALVSQLGFSPAAITLIATAVSELARNIFLHAEHGVIALEAIDDRGRYGVRIVARDHGPGISETTLAIIAASDERCAALGLCALKRLFDGFEIVSSAERGTTVTVQKWI
jgi:serine/threonine-protein kinase RsbT